MEQFVLWKNVMMATLQMVMVVRPPAKMKVLIPTHYWHNSDHHNTPKLCIAIPLSTTSSTTTKCFSHQTVAVAPPHCGDGTVDADEQCDDGGTTNGDGCSSICMNEGVSTTMR